MQAIYAHSIENRPQTDWQLLDKHLLNVAELSGMFADNFEASEWGYLAGLWHDLGKCSAQFQAYLENQNENISEEAKLNRVDHSTAGAQHAVQSMPILGHLLAYPIAGHHAGLLDARAEGACLENRLTKSLPSWNNYIKRFPQSPMPKLPLFISQALSKKDAFTVAFFVRMLFSCLVDADYLDTERFMKVNKAAKRRVFPPLVELTPRFFRSTQKLESACTRKPINILRRSVRIDSERKAEQPSGFFSLTVPTGGGKTLSSMAFALRHAQFNDLHRVIYVVPFTTIIEQNADVFRRHLGKYTVLEHHSNLDPEKETEASRLAAENWNAPVIVTTTAQFYDSLFANRTSRCRKLHRLAKSIIILDEAQSLPVEYLQPCLRVLKELVANYNSTVILCTATQPRIKKSNDFEIGLDNVREITSDPKELYRNLKRVKVKKLGKQTDADLKKRLLQNEKVLCIVNTTNHARLLFNAIGQSVGHFHLSARMCPAHRRLRLWQIRRFLETGKICRVVSTQVVEAGVDIDFPVVYRALAGLDSIAQAAGRCNRNSAMLKQGNTYVFTTEHVAAERYFSDTSNCAAQVMELYHDPLDLQANEKFFQLYYWDQKPRWDGKHILDNFHLIQDRSLPFNFGFAQTAKDFHLIDDTSFCTVIIPWGRKGRKLCQLLRAMPDPNREILRRAQCYMVKVHRAAWNKHAMHSIKLIYDNLGILESPETHYSEETGLNLEAEGPGSYFA